MADKILDLFIDSSEEEHHEPQLLDNYDGLQWIATIQKSNIDYSKSNLHMYTLTLEPKYQVHSKEVQAQLLKAHFESICDKYEMGRYSQIEYTKKGVAHLHAVVGEPSHVLVKEMREKMRFYGHIKCVKLYDLSGALAYINK